MKPIILMGTGEASRKIIKSLEACSGIRVRYLCDFKTVRVGIKIGGIEVISVEKMVEISKEYDVILANFKDEIAWKKTILITLFGKKMIKNHISIERNF